MIIRLILIISLLLAFFMPISALTLNPRVKTVLNISQHYGIDYGYEEYEVETGFRIGLTGGVAFDFPVTDVFSISQEFIYVTKGSKQKIKIADDQIKLDVSYQTDYLEFPTIFLLHYYRRNSFALFYQSGFSMSYLIYGRYKLEGNIMAGDDPYELNIDKRMTNIDQFDFGIITGGGVEFSLINKHFSLDYRINFGIPFIELPTTEDIFEEDPEGSRVKLRNQSYSISLGLFF
ncbi:MAG: PorT family protein [Candidatus Cloacimonetes bacterium]|nr:PorT family protein [Candidatus Cloacimonadota bacterium]